MSGTVRHARLESRSARARLKRGRQPHWQSLVPHRIHLGYQRWPDESAGRWILRTFVESKKKDGQHLYSRYRLSTLGRADDKEFADGRRILSHTQAVAMARELVDIPQGRAHRLTVRGAFERYLEFKQSQGQPVADLLSRTKAHILPILGERIVEDLTAEQLRRWLANLAASPAQTKPRAGKPQYRTEPVTDEDVRRRRASANRTMNYLKAMLNFIYDEGHVPNRDAWGRKLKPYRDVTVARIRYLNVSEAVRLINCCDPEFRPLVRAALESGARYSELTRLQVTDFDPDAGTLTVRKSKTNKARHVHLTDQGIQFFCACCAGRSGTELIFTHADGSPWLASHQGRPMAAATERAKLKGVSFHTLRHSWASIAAMNGVPMQIIAANLGHSSTHTTERHYAHLAPSHLREMIRIGGPKYGIAPDKRVVPIR
jgi:integrase